jgi:hypothetical protein
MENGLKMLRGDSMTWANNSIVSAPRLGGFAIFFSMFFGQLPSGGTAPAPAAA